MPDRGNRRISVFRFAVRERASALSTSVGTSATPNVFLEVPRLTSAQIELLDLIDTIANDPAYYLSLDFEPGDMQFLKNAAILHARTEYEDWPEPAKKRHLLRLWLTN